MMERKLDMEEMNDETMKMNMKNEKCENASRMKIFHNFNELLFKNSDKKSCLRRLAISGDSPLSRDRSTIEFSICWTHDDYPITSIVCTSNHVRLASGHPTLSRTMSRTCLLLLCLMLFSTPLCYPDLVSTPLFFLDRLPLSLIVPGLATHSPYSLHKNQDQVSSRARTKLSKVIMEWNGFVFILCINATHGARTLMWSDRSCNSKSLCPWGLSPPMRLSFPPSTSIWSAMTCVSLAPIKEVINP